MKYGSFKYAEKVYGAGDIKFIIDRTITDVVNKTAKGFLNYEDMNRIENNMSAIAENVGMVIDVKNDWKAGDFIFKEDFQRLESNKEAMYNILKTKMKGNIVLNDDFEQINYAALNHYERTLYEMYKAAEEG